MRELAGQGWGGSREEPRHIPEAMAGTSLVGPGLRVVMKYTFPSPYSSSGEHFKEAFFFIKLKITIVVLFLLHFFILISFPSP